MRLPPTTSFPDRLLPLIPAFLAGLSVLAATAGEEPIAASPHAYEIEEVPLPAAMSPEISGVAFVPGGALVAVNRHGEVWINEDPPGGQWRRYARGIHEPLGVFAVSESEILVTQRPELTRLLDTTGDGVADRYETVNDDWVVTDNWHEFTFGLRRDGAGDWVFSTGLPDLAGPLNERHPRIPLDHEKVHEERKPSPGQYLGWVLKSSPEGVLTPVAGGFRAPAGLGLSPEGDIFITDQQGDYIATSTLVHVQPGRFYGHPASLKWRDDYRGPVEDLAELAAMRSPEAVALPHGTLGGSPGEPVWDTTGGKFGPFGNQVFIGDFTRLVSRVFLEKVAGEYQGAAFPFLRDAVGLEAIQASSGRDNLTIPAGSEGLRHFRDVPPRGGTPLRPGNNRMAFAPDGSLYLGQTTRGWGQGDGMQRVVWSGRTPVEMEKVELTADGFRITFTTAMNPEQLADPATWRVSRFRYLYLPQGSPRADEAPCEITALRPSEDARSVELVLADLAPGYIYEFEPESLRSGGESDGAGRRLENSLAFYTLTRLLDGTVFAGPLSESLLAPEPATGDGMPDPGEGRRLFAAYCAICHQADGSGGALPGVSAELAAADLRGSGEGKPLSRSDEELMEVIAQGPEGKPMPPFGGVLKPAQLHDLVAYMREAFGDQDQ